GAVFSFLSALLGSIGPIMIPFFLAYGLVKGSLIGTGALATVVMHVTKLVVYRRVSILTSESIVIGLGLGSIMICGSFVGKKILDWLPERLFILLIEATLIVAGIGVFFHACTSNYKHPTHALISFHYMLFKRGLPHLGTDIRPIEILVSNI